MRIILRSCTVLIVLVLCFVLIIPNSTKVILMDNNYTIHISNIKGKTNDFKYYIIEAEVNGIKKEYIFDSRGEKLLDSTNENLYYDRVKYSIKINNEVIEIFDNTKRENIMILNLINEGFLEQNQKFKIAEYWSNTMRYLLVKETISNKSILIDIETRSVKKIPLEGQITSIEWSPNDEKAIILQKEALDNPKDKRKNYIWDIKNNQTQEINGGDSYGLHWIPGNNYIYYFEGGLTQTIHRYDISAKQWECVYTTKRLINEENIKWITEDVLVFPVSERSGLLSLNKLFKKRFEYFAIRFDIEAKKEKVIKLHAGLIGDYIWSYDNKYIYFLDNRGLHKEKVNF